MLVTKAPILTRSDGFKNSEYVEKYEYADTSASLNKNQWVISMCDKFAGQATLNGAELQIERSRMF